MLNSVQTTRQRRLRTVPSTPSSRWKEELRRLCLERAREKRSELIKRKRQMTGRGDSESRKTIRAAVKEELDQRGVSVFSPSKNMETSVLSDCPTESMNWSPTQPVKQDSVSFKAPELPPKSITSQEDYIISEEEYFELMEEIEAELQKEETLFLQEVDEAEKSRQRDVEEFQQLVADYQDWEETDRALNNMSIGH